MSRRLPYLLVMSGIVVLDQLTKLVVHGAMALHESRTLVEGLLSLTHIRNRGAAFGLLADADLPNQAMLFSAASLLALAAILIYSLKLPAASRLPQTALALVMGGAIGNLVDRALRGYVVDFVDVFWGSHHWPAFNVADASISLGVALLIVDMLRGTDEAAEGEIGEVASTGRTD